MTPGHARVLRLLRVQAVAGGDLRFESSDDLRVRGPLLPAHLPIVTVRHIHVTLYCGYITVPFPMRGDLGAPTCASFFTLSAAIAAFLRACALARSCNSNVTAM